MGTTNALAVSGSKSGSVLRYGNPVFDCGGAWVRALSRQLATVVSIGGVVSSENLDRLTAYIQRFILDDKPFVLDLSAVEAISTQAGAMLDDVAQACEDAGVQWVMVAGDATPSVNSAQDGVFPVVPSVAEALRHFADVNFRRRTMLLPLLAAAKLNKSA